jgi:hypothetical protein
MGKGKGNFKRWCTIVHPGRVFIEHVNVSSKTYAKYVSKLKIKLKIKLHIITISNKFIKRNTPTNTVVPGAGVFDLIKIRKTLDMTQKIFYENVIKKN